MSEKSIEDGFLDWFAGFIDGEGHFGLYFNNGNQTILPQFRLKVREDDAQIIVEIKNRLGFGNIYHLYQTREEVTTITRKGGKPQISFQFSKIDECVRLVHILDNHQLRSKKQKDYLIWRQAILEIEKNGTKCTPKLLQFKAELTKSHAYSANEQA